MSEKADDRNLVAIRLSDEKLELLEVARAEREKELGVNVSRQQIIAELLNEALSRRSKGKA